MMKRLTYFSLSLVLATAITIAAVAQTTTGTQDPKKTDTSKKTDSTDTKSATDTTTAANSDPSSKTYGGKVYGSVRLFVETLDVMKFNSRYYGKVVHMYAYFLSRPSALTLVFEDYKKNQVMVHLSRSNLYNLPILYKDKLYEIRAKVGKVRDGRLHTHYVELIPTFLEKDILDQQIR